ncbi:hypothetical protein SAY87_009663 [Trapa incisa]|uniref:H15 domain-containing protein n=1 Tax=Trapa incisa TaxID=236973 RepID=A0AAN7JY14_9MYRT|nr:hypothetical protein SAY87_009663 [Trapa incisa]
MSFWACTREPKRTSGRVQASADAFTPITGFPHGPCNGTLRAITRMLINAAIKGFTRTLSVEASPAHLRAHIEPQLKKLYMTHPTPDHPPYALMIRQAIEELNEVGGSNEEAISKMIKLKYQSLPWGHTSLLKHHLKKLARLGEIVLSRDCYMLPLEECDPIRTSPQQRKNKRRIFHKEKSTKQRKLLHNVAHSPEINEGQEGERDVEETKAVHCPYSEMIAQKEEMDAANIQVHELEQEEGQQDEEAVEGQRKEEQQGEGPVEELGSGHCPHRELVVQIQFEKEMDAANIQVHEQEESSRRFLGDDWIKEQGICQLPEWQNPEEDPKSAMKDKKMVTLENEIEEIEELIEPKANRSTQHETQAEAGSAIADNRTQEEESVLDGSLIPFYTSDLSREVVGSSVTSKEKCLELLKRTEKITKMLYGILESIDSRERLATVLGNEPVVPDVAIDLHLGRPTPPSLEQRQGSTFSKVGERPNFLIGVCESENLAQVTNSEGQGHQNRLVSYHHQFETETNAMPKSIAECTPLIYCEQTEQRRGMLTQEKHSLIDPETSSMRTSNQVLWPCGQKDGSNMQYTVPIEAATSTYYDIQRKVICQDTTQQQLLPFTAELERLTCLESRHSKMKGQPESSSTGKGMAIGLSQSVHREVKKYTRRGKHPKLKSGTDEGLSSITTRRPGWPPKKSDAGEETPKT